MITRKTCKLLVAFAIITCSAVVLHAQTNPPNVVVIFVDDLGYGDLGSYGHPTIRTPNIDQMGEEGIRFTQFYNAASICTPSRAALLTGRLPIRSGMAGSENSGNVLYPRSTGGLPQSEITIAEALKEANYQTAIIGKWHLGHEPGYMPLKQGFDYYFGIPYSNDMTEPYWDGTPPLPVYENDKVIEENPDQRLLTKRYTEKAIDFIKENQNQPFFLYYPNHFPHTPLYASDKFRDKSKRGRYGDVVEELDWSVGKIMDTLQDLQIAENTLVLFTSDNGPWLLRGKDGGSPGILYEGKGSTYEGGFRVPAVAWWPGTIEPNQTSEAITTTMDLYPTILNLAGVPVPDDRTYDGEDIYLILTGERKEVENDVVFYYFRDKIRAIRKGAYKAHFVTKPSYSKEEAVEHDPPLLFNIEHDPSEQYDISEKHPEIIEEIIRIKKNHEDGVEEMPSQLDKGY